MPMPIIPRRAKQKTADKTKAPRQDNALEVHVTRNGGFYVNPDDLLRSEQLKEILAKVDIPTFETGNLSPKEA